MTDREKFICNIMIDQYIKEFGKRKWNKLSEKERFNIKLGIIYQTLEIMEKFEESKIES